MMCDGAQAGGDADTGVGAEKESTTSWGSAYTCSTPEIADVLGIVSNGCVGSSTQSQNPFWAFTRMDVAPLHAAMDGTWFTIPK